MLTQSQGLFCFSHHPTREEAGGAQGVGRGHSWDSWPQLTKGIFQTMWRHAQHIKLGEEEGRGGTFRVMVFVFPSNRYVWWSLASWRWLNTCLPMGSSEWIPYFALLACTAFALPIKLFLSQPTSFLTFTLLILSPIPPWREWASGCVVLSCQLRLNHDSTSDVTEICCAGCCAAGQTLHQIATSLRKEKTDEKIGRLMWEYTDTIRQH